MKKILFCVVLCGILTLSFLGLASFAGATTWQAESVEGDHHGISDPHSMAINVNGVPYVLFRSSYRGNAVLKLAVKNGDSWDIDNIDTSVGNDYVGYANSITFDSFGNPVIAYRDSNGLLSYATKINGNWSIEPTGYEAGSPIGIKLDSFGNPYIISGAYLVFKVDGLWQREHLLTAGFTTGDCSETTDNWVSNFMSFDSDNNLHFVYQCQEGAVLDNIKYIKRDSNGIWTNEIIVGGFPKNEYASPSIILDGENNPYISFMNTSDNTLDYAIKRDGQWLIEAVDSNFRTTTVDYHAGEGTSIALDVAGIPYIAYYDSINHNLKLANKNGDSWTTQTITTINSLVFGEGFQPYMIITSDNVIHIAYDGGDGGWETLYTNNISGNVFTTKNSASSMASLRKKVVIKKNKRYLVNNFVLSFTRLPKKIKKKAYTISSAKYKKYPVYRNAKKTFLKRYWKVRSNLRNYVALKNSQKFKLRLMFSYKQSEFKVLKRKNKGLKENQLALKYYDVASNSWLNMDSVKQNKRRNYFTFTMTHYDFSEDTLFAIGKE
ncbi:MAG: hypothetical protein PHN19_04030 [Patescibacteria group bacterium]|nr:hypothetical protein [Patescibacteria group bacterium]